MLPVPIPTPTHSDHRHLIEFLVLVLLRLRRNTHQEDELRMSGDPRYSHLMEDLHVEISTFAAPAEAHARIAYALAEVRRFLVPVSEHKPICSHPVLYAEDARLIVSLLHPLSGAAFMVGAVDRQPR